MVNPTAIEQAREGKRKALAKLYAVMVVHEARETTDGDMAHLLDVPKQDLRNLRGDLTEVGSLHLRRIPKGRKGLIPEWVLVDSVDIARQKLNAKWQADDRQTVERVAQIQHTAKVNRDLNGATPDHPVVPSALVVSSGPDAPPPMAALGSERHDEPRALVEAARQFANLHLQVDRKVKELEALGISVDRERLTKAVRLPNDPRLVAVAEALPYIERLERANERLASQNDDLRGKARDLPEVQRQIARLRDQNQHLIADNTALRNQQSERAEVRPQKKHNGHVKPEAPKAPAPAG